MSLEDELLPCPFCGGEAKKDIHGKGTGCPQCGVWLHRLSISFRDNSHVMSRSVEEEAEAWNTRAQSAELTALRERADALAEAVVAHRTANHNYSSARISKRAEAFDELCRAESGLTAALAAYQKEAET